MVYIDFCSDSVYHKLFIFLHYMDLQTCEKPYRFNRWTVQVKGPAFPLPMTDPWDERYIWTYIWMIFMVSMGAWNVIQRSLKLISKPKQRSFGCTKRNHRIIGNRWPFSRHFSPLWNLQVQQQNDQVTGFFLFKWPSINDQLDLFVATFFPVFFFTLPPRYQILCGREIAKKDRFATQMANYCYLVGGLRKKHIDY